MVEWGTPLKLTCCLQYLFNISRLEKSTFHVANPSFIGLELKL